MSSSEKTTVMVVVQRWKELFEKVDSLMHGICTIREAKLNDPEWLKYALRDDRPVVKILVAEYTKTKAELEDYLRTNIRFGEPDPICGGTD